MSCLVKFNSQRYILLWCYASLVGNKKIKLMEALDKDDKESIWAMAKEIADGRINKNDVIELCKALYTLEYLLTL